MFCNKCGLKVEGSDAFCVGCGTPLEKNHGYIKPTNLRGDLRREVNESNMSYESNKSYESGGPYNSNRSYGSEGPYDSNRGYGSGTPYPPTGAYDTRGDYDPYRPYDSRGPGYAHPPRRSSKTPIIIAIACIAVVLIGLFAMNSGPFRDPLVGTWEYIENGDVFSVTFNRDGTGVFEERCSWSGRTDRDRFTYTVRGNRIRIYYAGFFEVEWEYRITGNRLIIWDRWDEWHLTRR